MKKPVVAVTLGDPAGIGPELVAKMVCDPRVAAAARLLVVADEWVWRQGQDTFGAFTLLNRVQDWKEASLSEEPALIALNTISPEEIRPGTVAAAAGRSARTTLTACLEAATRGDVDAICFAPLNKLALKRGGMSFEDELHFFASYFGLREGFCEFNVLGRLWTSRVSSHIPLADVAKHISKDGIIDAGLLIHRTLKRAGIENPRIAIAALNPHGGEGGTCGREEIDIIEPAAKELIARGLDIFGPFPADTIFLRARQADWDAVLTMYHDQGQIALKLLGFERGVTVQGGLPIPITTPAHGTAFDIVGQGKAKADAMTEAFLLAVKMVGEEGFAGRL